MMMEVVAAPQQQQPSAAPPGQPAAVVMCCLKDVLDDHCCIMFERTWMHRGEVVMEKEEEEGTVKEGLVVASHIIPTECCRECRTLLTLIDV